MKAAAEPDLGRYERVPWNSTRRLPIVAPVDPFALEMMSGAILAP
jgi:hypothetical protein